MQFTLDGISKKDVLCPKCKCSHNRNSWENDLGLAFCSDGSIMVRCICGYVWNSYDTEEATRQINEHEKTIATLTEKVELLAKLSNEWEQNSHKQGEIILAIDALLS